MKDKALIVENAKLKKTLASLREEIASLKEKIVTLQQEVKASKRQTITQPKKLPGEAQKILMFLSEHREATSKQVAHIVSLDYKRTDYWLKGLVKDRMVHAVISIGKPTKYSIGQNGTEYLMSNNMI